LPPLCLRRIHGTSKADAVTQEGLIVPQAWLGPPGHGEGEQCHFYAKRTAQGKLKEMDEKGRSLKADGRVKAKTKTKPGYGDRGDQAAEAVV
jgi:hypothetical protein